MKASPACSVPSIAPELVEVSRSRFAKAKDGTKMPSGLRPKRCAISRETSRSTPACDQSPVIAAATARPIENAAVR